MLPVSHQFHITRAIYWLWQTTIVNAKHHNVWKISNHKHLKRGKVMWEFSSHLALIIFTDPWATQTPKTQCLDIQVNPSIFHSALD